MPTHVYRTRLDPALADALEHFARDWQQPVSAVIRDCVRYILARPDLYPDILSERCGVCRGHAK